MYQIASIAFALLLPVQSNHTRVPAQGPAASAPVPTPWSLNGNADTDPQTQYIGTSDLAELQLRVNDVRGLRIQPFGTNTPNIVAGGLDNVVASTSRGSTIAGGESNDIAGSVNFIGSGMLNRIEGPNWSVIGGGNGNTVAFGATNNFIGSGLSNYDETWYGVIGGGRSNTILGASNFSSDCFIGGGRDNTIESGSGGATIPGGVLNRCAGGGTFAAGIRAEALHDGSFVWADGTNTLPLQSSAARQFTVQGSGGVRFFSDSLFTSGVELLPGAGAWSALSDRDSKENVEQVDPREVLEALSELEISTWNYKTQDDAQRHMGPMAQDFHAAFGLGEDERRISTIDTDGVALSAIQGLLLRLEQQDAEIDALQSELASLVQDLRVPADER